MHSSFKQLVKRIKCLTVKPGSEENIREGKDTSAGSPWLRVPNSSNLPWVAVFPPTLKIRLIPYRPTLIYPIQNKTKNKPPFYQITHTHSHWCMFVRKKTHICIYYSIFNLVTDILQIMILHRHLMEFAGQVDHLPFFSKTKTIQWSFHLETYCNISIMFWEKHACNSYIGATALLRRPSSMSAVYLSHFLIASSASPSFMLCRLHSSIKKKHCI